MNLVDFRSTTNQYIRPWVPVLIPSVLGVVFLVSIMATPYGQRLIHVRNYVLAIQYEHLAEALPDTTPDHIRFAAIASALWSGTNHYQFTTNVQPPIANSH